MAKPRFTLVDGPDNLREFDEGSTQSFVRGDIVKLSSNKVVIATGTGLSTNLLGVAGADATGTANSKIPVFVFSGEQIWQAWPKSTKKPTSFSLGVDYKIKQASAGAGEISTAAGTDVVVYSHTAMGKDGTTAEDPMLVKIDYTAIAMEEG